MIKSVRQGLKRNFQVQNKHWRDSSTLRIKEFVFSENFCLKISTVGYDHPKWLLIVDFGSHLPRKFRVGLNFSRKRLGFLLKMSPCSDDGSNCSWFFLPAGCEISVCTDNVLQEATAFFWWFSRPNESKEANPRWKKNRRAIRSGRSNVSVLIEVTKMTTINSKTIRLSSSSDL